MGHDILVYQSENEPLFNTPIHVDFDITNALYS